MMEDKSKAQTVVKSATITSAISISKTSAETDLTQKLVVEVVAKKNVEKETSKLLKALQIFLYYLVRLPLYLSIVVVRIWKMAIIICRMAATGYKMLCFMYNYPMASRHATWIAYRALMISYQLELWSLTGFCGQYASNKDGPTKEETTAAKETSIKKSN